MFRIIPRRWLSGNDALRQLQYQSQQRMRSRRFAWLVGAFVFPLSCLSLYDRLAALPEPLNRHRYPFLARIFIRKALLFHSNNVDAMAKDLDSALWAVMNAGLGAASPQSTALVIFISKQFLKEGDPKKLEEALAALTHKPHVGEALEDEKARLEMGLDVVQHLCTNSSHRCGYWLSRFEETIHKTPPQISFKLGARIRELSNKFTTS